MQRIFTYIGISSIIFAFVFCCSLVFDEPAAAETPAPPAQMNDLDAAKFYGAQQRIQVIQLSANMQINEQRAKLADVAKRYKFTLDDLDTGAVTVSPEGAISRTPVKPTAPTKK
jgi:hypothetical protein